MCIDDRSSVTTSTESSL
ncbi:hypothetical protein Pmar_PMAR007638, partial [Perkinsus marinus ATCC 50983]